MASLLSADAITTATGALYDLWDTFDRTITIHKEPIVTYTSPNADVNAYSSYRNDRQQNQLTTKTAVNSTFPAKIIYPLNQAAKDSLLGDEKMFTIDGAVAVKVLPDCRNYINERKTEKIVVDGISYNTIRKEEPRNFLGLTFYIFHLDKDSKDPNN